MELPFVYHPDYVTPLPDGHRFPMDKFGMLYRLLLDDGVAVESQFHHPRLATVEELLLVHEQSYIDDFRLNRLDGRAWRRIGLPWSENLVHRSMLAVGGTIRTAELALQQGLACNTAGGTHHAFPDFGAGFCVFNDIAVAAKVIQQQGLCERIMIIDLDVHQGDGTAFIFQNDPSVYTFSMHCEKNFPSRKQHSNRDVGLPVGMMDNEYLEILKLELMKLFQVFDPDLIFFDAGVDTHANDRLGLLKLSYEGLYARERMVLETCRQKGYPVACVIGGGYGQDLSELACRHSILHRVARFIHGEFSLAS